MITHYLSLVLAWCLSHPAEVTMAVGAVCSLVYPYLAKYPRLRTAFEALAHAGVNVPALVSALLRLLASIPAKAAAVVVFLLGFSYAACASLTAQDKGDLAQYEAQQGACIAANPHNQAAMDACRAQVKAQWCASWAARFDGGICQ